MTTLSNASTDGVYYGRPPHVDRTYKRWSSALLAIGIDYLVRSIGLFVLGIAGITAGMAIGLSGAVPSAHAFFVVFMAAAVVVQLGACLIVSGFLKHRRASRPLVAALVGGLGGFAIGNGLYLAGLDHGSAPLLAQLAVEFVTIAWITVAPSPSSP